GDDEHAPQREEDRPPPALVTERGLDAEVDRRRDPHHRGAHHRQQREDGSDRPPQQRARHAGDEQTDGGGHTLRERGHHLAAEGGVDDGGELAGDLPVVSPRQWRQHGELVKDRRPFDEEVEGREQHQEEAQHHPGEAADYLRAMARHPPRRLAYHRQYQPI